VFAPVFSIIIIHCPHWTIVPIKISPQISLVTGTDSPVSIASIIKSLLTSVAFPSPAILSHALRTTISPGTRNSTAIVCLTPSLITLTVDWSIFFNASNSFPALLS